MDLLRDALQRVGDTAADLEALRTAIARCHAAGETVAHAEKRLAQWEAAAERHKAAETELIEAAAEVNPVEGQQRLQQAVLAAESSGVSHRVLRDAQDKLD